MKKSDDLVSSPTRRALLAGIGALACLGATGGAGAVEANESAGLLAEIRKTFTLRGKPIPPEIFRDFGDGNLADSGAIWTSVDLDAAVGSNQYFNAIRQNGGWVTQGRAAAKGNEAEESAYRYIGAAKSGLLIAVATWNGGGSGVFTFLHVLDLAPTRAFDDEGKPYTRITLTNLRSVPLGDRWDGEVTISGDDIRIATRGGAGKAPKSIQARRP